MATPAQQAFLDDLFGQADFDRRLYALRAANPSVGYELDEIARAVRRARDRVASVLFEPPPSNDDAADLNA